MSLVPVPQPVRGEGGGGRYSVICVAALGGFAAALLFSAFPAIDLAVSRIFYTGEGAFLFARPSFAEWLRLVLRWGFIAACLAAVAGFVLLAFFGRRLGGLGLAAWVYMMLCAAIGPGLVTNVLLKDQWGRARPAQVVEFGGTKAFTPPLLRTNQCERNCSFVSGEASNYFMLGFALALLAEAGRRRRLFLAAIAAGSFAGLLRIGAGGHFLSDVVFAGVFMALVARGLAWLILERSAPHLADGGPFHRRAQQAGEAARQRSQLALQTAKHRLRREKS